VLESANGRIKTAQIVLSWSKVKEVLVELHEGFSGHPGVNKVWKLGRTILIAIYLFIYLLLFMLIN
jgi:hypothetical protein